MRRFLLTTAAATAVMLGGCIYISPGQSDYDKVSDHAACSTIEHGYGANGAGGRVNLEGCDINSRLDTDNDARLVGSDISASGRVGGLVQVSAADFVARDLTAGALDASAADFVYSGAVDGDVELRAADILWRGPVGGDFDATAADLDFDGVVDGHFKARLADARLSGAFASLELQAADAHLAREAVVRGDVYAALADLRHDGRIEGSLDLTANTAILNGDVEGELLLNADPGRQPWSRTDGLVELNGEIAGGEICARRVVITGTVAGPLRVTADAPPEIQSGSAANIDFTPRNGRACERGWEG